MAGAVFISGENIDLLTIEEEDIEWMRDNINDPEIRAYTSRRYPVNIKQEKEFFEESVSSGDNKVHLMISYEGERRGVISLMDIDMERGNAEIGLWISSEEQGKGIGTEASRLMTDYGFKELRLHRIFARVFEHNPASARVWEKLGYEEEGVMREHGFIDGDYQNLRIYGILREEWRKR